MSDLLTSEDLKTERATEPPKRWRNKWRVERFRRTIEVNGPRLDWPVGVHWGVNVWPSKEIAEAHARETEVALSGDWVWLGAFPVDGEAP